MSALTGVPGANGRISTTTGAPVFFRRGMGFGPMDFLTIVTSAPGGFFNGSVMADASGRVMTSLVNSIANYVAGLPLDSNGGLCTEAAAPVTFVQGVGLTAAGRVAVAESVDNPTAWFRFGVGITVTGAGVSSWADQSGNGRDLLQATDANRPALQADGSILFDGVDNFLKTAPFTLNNPFTIYLALKQLSWTDGDRFCDGNTDNTADIGQFTATPNIFLYGGSGLLESTALAENVYGVIGGVFNGGSSVLRINNTIVSGSAGVVNAGGFTLGRVGTSASQFSNIQVKEAILYSGAHTAAQQDAVIEYLSKML